MRAGGCSSRHAPSGEEEFFLGDEDNVEGECYTAGGVQSLHPIDNYRSAVRAIELATGDIRWEFEMKLAPPVRRPGHRRRRGQRHRRRLLLALDVETGESVTYPRRRLGQRRPMT